MDKDKDEDKERGREKVCATWVIAILSSNYIRLPVQLRKPLTMKV